MFMSLRWSFGLFAVVTTALLLLGAWALYLRPAVLGGPASYVIVNGSSMEPTLRHGDLAVLHRRDGYAPGDIVAFRAEGGVAIHRVQSVLDDGNYVTKGDNKDATDPWLPSNKNVLGEMVLRVPYAGTIYQRGGFAILGMLIGFAVTLVAFAPSLSRERSRSSKDSATREAMTAHMEARAQRHEEALEDVIRRHNAA
jgi:signal peptidase I